jgi:hypothetical protein
LRYNIDNQFSHHKDILLKDYWAKWSFENRFIFARSELLQRHCGIDVILQGAKNDSDIKIDTKHVRGKYTALYLEEESCPKYHTPGWITKETGHPDWICYCFWSSCKTCYCACTACTAKVLVCETYICDFMRLRKWFTGNKDRFHLDQNEGTVNETTGRVVPIKILRKEIGLKYIGQFSFLTPEG